MPRYVYASLALLCLLVVGLSIAMRVNISWLGSILTTAAILFFIQSVRRHEAEPEPIAHPIFGRVFPSVRPKKGPWHWETLDDLKHSRGSLTVTMEAGPSGPVEAQAQFWHWLCEHIDEIVEECRPLLTEELPHWNKGRVPQQLWDELIWVGADLPVGGDRFKPWEVTFEIHSNPGPLISIVYEGGKPARAYVDD
jgi:hypothetical protein